MPAVLGCAVIRCCYQGDANLSVRYRHAALLSPALLVLLVLLLPCSPARAGLLLEADTVYYTGPVSAAQNRELFAKLADRKVGRLLITSTGGEVEAGIALGSWVFAHGIDIEVVKYCLSSCANYVFSAGRHKTIRPGAVVAWHGNYNHLVQTGLWQDDIAARRERTGEDALTARQRVHAEAVRLARLEQDFFARIGVDEYLCWIGKQPPYSVANYYFLSTDDMARFGVQDVQAPDDYAGTDLSGLDFRIEFISLD